MEVDLGNPEIDLTSILTSASVSEVKIVKEFHEGGNGVSFCHITLTTGTYCAFAIVLILNADPSPLNTKSSNIIHFACVFIMGGLYPLEVPFHCHIFLIDNL